MTDLVVSNFYRLKTTLTLKVMSRLFPDGKWTSNFLQEQVRAKQQGIPLRPFFIKYSGQSGGAGTEHEWVIGILDSNDIQARDFLMAAITDAVAKKSANALVKSKVTSDQQWWINGIEYRSPAEVAIGEALEKQHIFFFVNARCRIPDRNLNYFTKELDFVVFINGETRVLEVDGREFHQQAAEDHKRDRLIEKHGLRTARFTAKECLESPDEVVVEFMSLFKNLFMPNS